MPRLKHDVAIWENTEKTEIYALPLGVKDAYGATIYPVLNDHTWKFHCTLPAGAEVTNVVKVNDQRVKCTLAGITVHTAEWALD